MTTQNPGRLLIVVAAAAFSTFPLKIIAAAEDAIAPATSATETPESTAAAPAGATPRNDARPQEYGPTQRGDTLAGIARSLRGDGSTSTEQMIWALFEANPDAFDRGDINRLKLGVVLTVPAPEAINAVDRATARNEIARRAQPAPSSADASDRAAIRALEAQLDETRQEAEETQKERELLKNRLKEMEKKVEELLRQNAERDAVLRKQGITVK